jgi:hypothetical protein
MSNRPLRSLLAVVLALCALGLILLPTVAASSVIASTATQGTISNASFGPANVGFCDFFPTWPNVPAYNGNALTFALLVLEWGVLAVGSALFDLVGALAIGLACLTYTSFTAIIGFLSAVFIGSVGSILAYGALAPLVALGIVAVSAIILSLLFLFLFGEVGKQGEADVEELEGKTPPSTVPESEIGIAEQEI